MRNVITALFTATTLLVAASFAHAAGGLAMRWDNCYGDGGSFNKDFACNTNSGSETVVLSFKPPADLDQVNGNEIVVDVRSSSPTLPSWWQFIANQACRQTALSVTATLPPNSSNCITEFGPTALSGIMAYTIGFGGPDYVRMRLAVAIPQPEVVTLHPDQEYVAMNLVISNRKTTGTSSCSGCLTPACLLFSSVTIHRGTGAAGIDVLLEDPLAPGSDVAGWQGGSASTDHSNGFWTLSTCSLPTPARNATWGAIKLLYR